MRRKTFVLWCVLGLLAAGVISSPADASGDHRRKGLEVSVVRAPVAPDGDVAGAQTDIVVTFRDIDPEVDGVGLKSGGTIRVRLPESFRNTGDRPVASSGSSPDCSPPLVSGCSTAVLLQGWPQSPVLPFPAVTYEADTNTVVLTAAADWFPAGEASPGPKQVHLMLFGFANPSRAGRYPISLEIKPDPNADQTLRGRGHVRIRRHGRPNINPNSQANGAPPPPFPNPIFQRVQAGDPSLTMAFYLWERDIDPYLGVDFVAGSDRRRPLVDANGKRIGTVRVRAPRGASEWSLESGGPSTEANAFITGLPTGRMTAVLHTDPEASGTYRITFRMFGGNALRHTIRVD